MVINNPNFAETIGNVADTTSSFSGVPEFRLYDANERKNLTNYRKETYLQSALYNLPNVKLL